MATELQTFTFLPKNVGILFYQVLLNSMLRKRKLNIYTNEKLESLDMRFQWTFVTIAKELEMKNSCLYKL